MLALLDRGPAHGYELKRAHDELFGDVAPPINVGQIYVTLTRLERDGNVAHHVEEGTGGPDRKVYELTETGRKALRGWLDEPSDLPVGKSDVVQRLVAGLIYDANAAHAAHGAHGGDGGQPAGTGAAGGDARSGSAARTLAAHRTRCLRALRALTAVAPTAGADRDGDPADHGPSSTSPGASPADPAVAGIGDLLREASLLHLQAELRWLDIVEARLARYGRT
ncbi:PadR family transcriptional regulator [Frankia sp. CNm7]|uniref:PadR family transcriptional regulator n=2 Tax=Frankia nepalensis TaxID=1836974 RepID=A0A937RM29_9ACTN|nr:PadR family transcriptional regulator [Frankia nepalensis]MBL7514460.1 PadR family transcriptional regulator [Frankia nepalensis]MBL7523547.1 PadR family transcriptional regulator [Frankia nepalensis]MBL7632735.1 PadR family transcriptional regulator [Frankia nepalensis]